MKTKFIILILLSLLPISVSAFSAELLVDTGNTSINALEAVIHLPRGVSVDKVYTGNSAILFWIKPPTYDEFSHIINFSGITPGGFRGTRIILSFSGELTKADLSRLTFSEVRALANDGLGTIVTVELRVIETKIREDNDPPELFDLTISSSPDLFEGTYFLSFATQDKGTGIERYEYASTWLLSPRDGSWLETKSPIILSREMLFQKIYVRAVDSSGNYRVVSIAGPYHYASLFIGIIILLCIFLLLRRLASRRYSYFSLHP